MSSPVRVVAPTRVKRGRSILTERAPWPLANDQVQLVILHGWIEDLLHGMVEPMDLIDKEHVPGLEAGEDGGQIPGALNYRA